jgi:hypothetical protein
MARESRGRGSCPPVTPPAHVARRRAGGLNFSSGLGCTSLNSGCLPDSRWPPGKRIRNFFDRQHLFQLVDGIPMAPCRNPAFRKKLRNDSTRLPKKIPGSQLSSVLGSVKDHNATRSSWLVQNNARHGHKKHFLWKGRRMFVVVPAHVRTRLVLLRLGTGGFAVIDHF